MCGFIFYLLLWKLFIIIFRKPLLVAMLRLMEIFLLLEKIKTSKGWQHQQNRALPVFFLPKIIELHDFFVSLQNETQK